MKIDSKNLKEYFKNAKPMDFAYPITIIIYVIILAVLFSIATKFINENINNKIPTSENKSVQHLLNIDNYVLTAKKLNIPVTLPKETSPEDELPSGTATGTPETDIASSTATSTIDITATSTPSDETAISTTPTEASTTTPETTKATTTTATSTLNKSSVTLTILNSTPTTGLASALAKKVTAAGFNEPKTGNQKTKLATTTIYIKDTKKDFGPSIKEAVHTLYPSVVIGTTTPKETETDIIIVIGEH